MINSVILNIDNCFHRFCHKLFNNNYKATIGVDFEVERFDILGVPFNLQMYVKCMTHAFNSCIQYACEYDMYHVCNTQKIMQSDVCIMLCLLPTNHFSIMQVF